MKIKALRLIRGAKVILDPGQVADLMPALAEPLLRAGVIERVSGVELATAPPAERAVVPDVQKVGPPQPEPPSVGWPPNKRIKKSPAEYLKAAPGGKWADLARQHIGE